LLDNFVTPKPKTLNFICITLSEFKQQKVFPLLCILRSSLHFKQVIPSLYLGSHHKMLYTFKSTCVEKASVLDGSVTFRYTTECITAGSNQIKKTWESSKNQQNFKTKIINLVDLSATWHIVCNQKYIKQHSRDRMMIVH
jgi:hypothetical protein